jgi:hypothetical protein
MNTLNQFSNELKSLSSKMEFTYFEDNYEEMLFYDDYSKGGVFVWIDEESGLISIDLGRDMRDNVAGIMGSEPSGSPTNFKSTKEAAAFLLTILWKSKLDYIIRYGE